MYTLLAHQHSAIVLNGAHKKQRLPGERERGERMGKRRTYMIGNEFFSTKGELQERIKAILYGYEDGEALIDADQAFMAEVLKGHAEYQQKVGAGIRSIHVGQNPTYPSTRCFWIDRTDGSGTDFSYTECLKETPHAKRFTNACRVAVEGHVQAFKASVFSEPDGKAVHCPYTGELLSYIGSHVDHKSPNTFQALVQGFIAENSIDVDQVKLNGKGEDNIYQDTFDDKELERAWVEYHNARAELQLVSQTANLSLLRRSAGG